jgi:MATE family multidrug resistance protein
VFVVAPINILITYVLVWSPRFGLGFVGAPMASAISMDLMGLLMLLYCYLYAPRTGWGGFSMQVFRNWGENVRLGLSGLVRAFRCFLAS